MIRSLLIVGAGSCLGGMLRYWISRTVHISFIASLAWQTLIVNVLGCLVIGVLYGLMEKGHLESDALRLFLAVGFCGGFTTFSTFMNENFGYLQSGQSLMSLLYVALSLFVGLLAVYLGHWLVRMF